MYLKSAIGHRSHIHMIHIGHSNQVASSTYTYLWYRAFHLSSHHIHWAQPKTLLQDSCHQTLVRDTTVLISSVRVFCRTPVPQQHYFCLQLTVKFVSWLTADERPSSAFQYKMHHSIDNRMLMVLLLQESFHNLRALC